MKNLTWQNPEQLFVAQVLIKKVKLKCCGIKVSKQIFGLGAQKLLEGNAVGADNQGFLRVVGVAEAGEALVCAVIAALHFLT